MPHAARRRRAARRPPSSLLRSSFRRDLRASMQHSGDTLRMSPAFFISYRTPAGSGHQPSFGLAWQRRGRQVCAKASCIEGHPQRETRAQRQYFKVGVATNKATNDLFLGPRALVLLTLGAPVCRWGGGSAHKRHQAVLRAGAEHPTRLQHCRSVVLPASAGTGARALAVLCS